MVKFYNSIPGEFIKCSPTCFHYTNCVHFPHLDYEELNHLTETEFYSRLGTLRQIYSKIKYGSDTTLSSDTSKSSEESIETVKERRIKPKQVSPKIKENGKENREPADTPNITKDNGNTLFRLGVKPSRRIRSASPARRSSLKGNKTLFGPKCKSLNRYESPTSDFELKARGKKKRAGYIPLTSRVPIYDQIMEDQKQR